MSKYPKINYIGNKNKLTDWIVENLPYKKGTVLDLFCGGCSVSYALKDHNYQVITNDVLYSNYVISKAIIENKKVTLNKKDIDVKIDKKDIDNKYNNIKFLSNKLYFDEEVHELAELLCIADMLNDEKKYLFLALIRRAMIRKIPYSRMNVPWDQIVKLRDEEYSYKKYKRRRAYHNKTFMEHILDNIKEYNDSVFDNKKDNKSYNLDSFDMIDKLDKSVDIIYMDPPYPGTMDKYDQFYGLFDEMFNIKIDYVNFSLNNMFLDNLEKLVKKCAIKTKYIVISENNKTKPSVDELKNMLKKYGTVKILEKKHQYKVTNKDNKNESYEVLIILKIKKEEI